MESFSFWLVLPFYQTESDVANRKYFPPTEQRVLADRQICFCCCCSCSWCFCCWIFGLLQFFAIVWTTIRCLRLHTRWWLTEVRWSTLFCVPNAHTHILTNTHKHVTSRTHTHTHTYACRDRELYNNNANNKSTCNRRKMLCALWMPIFFPTFFYSYIYFDFFRNGILSFCSI